MSKFTPGPWHWTIGMNGVRLETQGHGRLVVMDSIRSGMNGADFMFSDRNGELRGGILERAKSFDLRQHPDARLIVAAPTLYTALSNLVTHYESIMREEPRDEDDEEWLPELNEARKVLAMVDGKEVA